MNEDCFIDSGAWSLFRLHVLKKGKKAKKSKSSKPDFSWFDLKTSGEFREYCDNYAAFIKARSKQGVRWFANVDVIGNAEMTRKSQIYFEEKHGVSPVPVVHFPADLKYLKWYLNRDDPYAMIGLGGFARRPDRKLIKAWTDECFKLICPKENDYMPTTKVHGFAMTTWELFRRWPWYSVDSTSYLLYGTYGLLCVPRWDARLRNFRFDIPPKILSVSARGRPIDYKTNLHVTNRFDQVDWSHTRAIDMAVGPAEGRELLTGLGHGSKYHSNAYDWTMKWIEFCGVPLGKVDKDGNEVEKGVISNNDVRTEVNIRYFMELESRIPKWPWPLPKQIIEHSATRNITRLFI